MLKEHIDNDQRMQINVNAWLSLWSLLPREWRNSVRDSAPVQDLSTAPHSEAALHRMEEDKTFQYSTVTVILLIKALQPPPSN